MVRGLYTAAAGAIVAQSNADIITNNLANSSSHGFKRALLQLQSRQSDEIFRIQTDPGQDPLRRTAGKQSVVSVGQLGAGVEIYDSPTIYEQGSIEITNNEFDFALTGPGFFAVQDEKGKVHYTRDGQFVRAADRYLVTTAGEKVLGTDGAPIILPPEGKVDVGTNGNITVDRLVVGTIGVFKFDKLNSLRPAGGNNFNINDAVASLSTDTAVIQGAQEKGNANVIRSMVELITTERWYDANEKVISSEDAATNLAISAVGRTNS